MISKPHPANARRHQNTRIAIRAALAGARLDPAQLKLVVKEHDTLFAKGIALNAEADKVVAATQLGSTTDHGYAVAGRRLDQLHSQDEALTVRAQKLRAHPQVRAVLVARVKAEERAS